MLERIIAILFPVFAIAAVGYLVARRDRPDMGVANKLTMDVFSPALIFGALAARDFHVAQFSRLALAMLLVTIACGVGGYLLARLLKQSPRTLIPPVMFGNSANLGIPLAVLAFGNEALQPAVILFMVSTLLHFTYGSWLLGRTPAFPTDCVETQGLPDKACDAVQGGSPAQGAQRSTVGPALQPFGRAQNPPHLGVAAPSQGGHPDFVATPCSVADSAPAQPSGKREYVPNHKLHLGQIWKVPNVIATILGLAVSLSGLVVWQPLVMALKLLGDIAIPLMLFSLGVRMTDIRFDGWRVGVIGGLARPLIGGSFAGLAAWLLGLSSFESALLIIYGALPPAVMNYLFAERYSQEPDKVASIVLIGNLLAILVLPVVLAFAL